MASILDSIICLPDLDIGLLVPCPFEEISRSLKHKKESHIVREIILELRDKMLLHITEVLKRNNLDYLHDVEPLFGGSVLLTGARNNGTEAYCSHRSSTGTTRPH